MLMQMLMLLQQKLKLQTNVRHLKLLIPWTSLQDARSWEQLQKEQGQEHERQQQ